MRLLDGDQARDRYERWMNRTGMCPECGSGRLAKTFEELFLGTLRSRQAYLFEMWECPKCDARIRVHHRMGEEVGSGDTVHYIVIETSEIESKPKEVTGC